MKKLLLVSGVVLALLGAGVVVTQAAGPWFGPWGGPGVGAGGPWGGPGAVIPAAGRARARLRVQSRRRVRSRRGAGVWIPASLRLGARRAVPARLPTVV